MAHDFESLCKLLKLQRSSAVKRHLKRRGIRFSLDAKGRPWTTEAELDRALSPVGKKITFTKPPCKKKNYPSRRAFGQSTALGTTSSSTSGERYAG